MAQLCDLGAGILAGPQLDGTYRFHDKDGQDIGQMCIISTFSEYTVVNQDSVCLIDNSYPLDKACLVGCGVATGYGAVTNRAKVTPGSTVLVVGVGGIGMNAIQGAAAANASMVIAADVFDHKLEWAKEFGATHTINAKKDDLVSKVMEMTNGQGVDFSFEAIGTPETVGQAFAATGKGGTTVAIGVNPAAAETIPISPFMLTLYQKSLMGTLYGTSNPQTEIPKLLNLYKVGKLKLDQLITKTYKLDDVNEAYADMIAGKNIRGVIMFD
jgi:S-(hydroxymethyl)glutathione dehydrogenase/alcohol dehydrogenase